VARPLGFEHAAAGVVARPLGAAERERRAVGEHEPLDQVAEHHHAAQRVGERGDEHPVVLARVEPGDARRAVAADAVGDEPLAADEGLDVARGAGRAGGPGHLADDVLDEAQRAGVGGGFGDGEHGGGQGIRA
jgi:hypothetical protein